MISNSQEEVDHSIDHVSPRPITTSNKYRPDIDGLRAVAVLLVIAYHLDISSFSGGFIGVDIFFVISGYLIGAILITEMKTDTFSFRRFYERRIRRIIPALTVMFLLSGLGSILVLLPVELVDYSKSLIAALFSFSNVFFWLKSGYFDAQAATKPLLHTWSLGVEEQFYLLYPPILLVIIRLFPSNIQNPYNHYVTIICNQLCTS